jgi:hypothetical protein
MRKCACGLILGLGFCAGCGALATGEIYEFNRPSAPACSLPPIYRGGDIGPPVGCDDGSLPHSRIGWFTSVASTNATVTTGHAIIIDVPTVAFEAREAEDAAEPIGPRDEVVTFGPPMAAEYRRIRPTIDEVLALIRQSDKLTD